MISQLIPKRNEPFAFSIAVSNWASILW
jgi:hypothetical protein